MIFIEPEARWETKIDRNHILKKIEKYGRVCYKSEDKITADSAERFIKAIVSRGHLSVVEHISLSSRWICSRGCSHELVRHRLASFSQESTRYCNYQKKGLQIIYPYFLDREKLDKIKQEDIVDMCNREFGFIRLMYHMENEYNHMLSMGLKPEDCRSVLPNQIKTELYITANLREWLHIFKMRCASDAHPEIKALVTQLRDKLQEQMPELF